MFIQLTIYFFCSNERLLQQNGTIRCIQFNPIYVGLYDIDRQRYYHANKSEYIQIFQVLNFKQNEDRCIRVYCRKNNFRIHNFELNTSE